MSRVGTSSTDHLAAPRWGTRALLAVVAALAVTAVGGLVAVVWPHGHQNVNAAGTVCPSPRLRVAVAPEIAGIVRSVAGALGTGGTACSPVYVSASDPATVALSARTGHPDMWIPSSSAWVEVANAGGTVFDAPQAVIARSPVVIVGPAPLVQALWPDHRTGWADIVRKVSTHQITAMNVPDPLRDTVGLLTVLGINAVTAAGNPDPGIAQLQALSVRGHLADSSASPGDLFTRYAAQSDPAQAGQKIGVFVATEQQLLGYRNSSPKVPLEGYRPVDGAVEADYPVVTARDVAGDPVRRDLAARLAARLATGDTGQRLLDAGFETGRKALQNNAVPLPAAGRLVTTATQWSRYRIMRFQVLILVDISGSMNEPAAGHLTKADLLRQSGAEAAKLFGDETTLGLWYFGTPTAKSPAYTEAVPLGPLDKPEQRALVAQRIAGYRAVPGAGTPLYQSILDGVALMAPKVTAGVVTLVVVLTDGTDESSRFAMSQATFLTRLSTVEGPRPTVPVMTIGYGANADIAALQAIARATGGQAVPATHAADLSSAIARAFLAAHGATG